MTDADLGAQVIKVESPEGDDTRGWGPPFVAAADGGDLSAAYFHACNRGKRSIVADFTTGAGRETVCRLAASADVVMLGNQALNYLVPGVAPTRLGNAHPNVVPYEVFPTRDGHVTIAVGNDGQFRRLCAAIGADALAAATDYAHNSGRVASARR